MSDTPNARAAIDALQEHEAWAIIRRSTRAGDRDTVGMVGGRRWVAESLLDIPVEQGPPAPGRQCDRLVAVPFRQVAERGFEAHDDGAPLTVVDIDLEVELPFAELLAALPDEVVAFRDRGGFETSDDEYAAVVRCIIDDEIGNGEGANLVVGRHYRAQLEEWGPDQALTVLRRLLERETLDGAEVNQIIIEETETDYIKLKEYYPDNGPGEQMTIAPGSGPQTDMPLPVGAPPDRA